MNDRCNTLITLGAGRRLSRRQVIAGAAGVSLAATIGGAAAFAQQANPSPVASPSSSPNATPSTTQSATPAIVAAANAFLATLSDTEQKAVLFDWTDNAQKQRWSNLPQGLYQRAGLMWGNIAQPPQDAWLKLMQTTLSTEGYNRVLAEWSADDALAAESSGGGANGSSNGTSSTNGNGQSGGNGPGGGPGGQMNFGRTYYWIAVIGNPSATDPWQWQFGGHHVTINATIAGSHLALTPSFIGVQPATYTDANGKTVRPLGDIEDEAFALVNDLDSTQQKAAILGKTYVDLVLGPGQDGKTLQPEGLPATQMTEAQRTALVHLIGHYTGLAYDGAAAARAAEITAGLDQTYFAWYGGTTEGSAAYFRVTGPAIVIEYSPQQGGGQSSSVQGPQHIHGIYRDPTNDYGAKYTGIKLTS